MNKKLLSIIFIIYASLFILSCRNNNTSPTPNLDHYSGTWNIKGYRWILNKAQWDSAETSDQLIISKNDAYQYLGDNTYLIIQKLDLSVYDEIIIKVKFYDDNSGEIYIEIYTINNIFGNIPYFKGTITR